MLGIAMVVIAVVLAAYLIIKKYYAPWALLMVGILLILCVWIITGKPIVTGKTATHNFLFDIVQVFTNLLKSRTAGLGMNIMVVGGFAYYMDKIGATKALVNICTKPLSKIKKPYLLLGIAYLIGQLLNVFIPSATGLGMLLMVTIYPLLIGVGVSRVSAAAMVVTASCLDLGPASGNSLLAGDISQLHVMEYFIQNQLPVGLVTAITIAVAHCLIQRYLDKKDLASGRITQQDFMLPSDVEAKGAAEQPPAPAYYALLPILPVVLLFVFSKLVYNGIRLEVVTALLSCTIIAFLVDLLTHRHFKLAVNNTKTMFGGMGKVFSSTIMLIICAEVFAEGLKRSGGIDTIIGWAANMQGAAGVTMLIVMFGIMALAAFVTGSGNAAFFAFSPLLPQAAKSVMWDTVVLAVPVQLASGIARSMSPISGVTMAVAGLSGVSPFDLVRRTIPIMALALAATFISSLVIL